MVAARRFASIEVEAKRLTKVILFWRGAILATSLRRKYLRKPITDTLFSKHPFSYFHASVFNEFSQLRFLPTLFLIFFLRDCNKNLTNETILSL